MQFIGWMYDVAREQAPSEALLRGMLTRSATTGYNAVGLYVEHRLAYPSAPFAAGEGCLRAETVRELLDCGVRVLPFLNTLGHMEGFIRAEGGQWLAEGPGGPGGQQICASRPACAAFAQQLVADALDAFADEWVHLGGDETRQLGQCPQCAARVREVGPGGLYGEYYGRLCRWVLEQDRRPCLWGDMLIAHPDAMDALPPETVIFDWHYDGRPAESLAMFRSRGFDVVCCPAVHTFDAAWCFLPLTQRNIDEHAEDAAQHGALGVLVTTWELSSFTQYAGILPLIYAAGRRLAAGTDWPLALAEEGGPAYVQVAEILGRRLPEASAFLRPGTWRQLRDRLVMRQDPFALWRDWRGEACGAAGDAILRLCDEAGDRLSPEHTLQFAVELHRVAVEWVRLVERAYAAYVQGNTAACAELLAPGRALLERLRPRLLRVAEDGGSAADVARLDILESKVERARARVSALPGGDFRPAFDTLVHDAYVPGDQAAWPTSAK
ncbi:MAG: family 20 glycosylhydrolase [Phycisphaerae bacterium]|jgi:hypothetical protein